MSTLNAQDQQEPVDKLFHHVLFFKWNDTVDETQKEEILNNNLKGNFTKAMTKQFLITKMLLGCVLMCGTMTLAANDDWNWDNEIDFSPNGQFNQPNLDSLEPIKDRTGDYINNSNNNSFDLKDPSVIEKKVTYDPATGLYIITEKVGNSYYRPPTYMTYDEYMKWSANNQRNEYSLSIG